MWAEWTSSMNESTPLSIVATDHVGTQLSGWKSDMERQSRRPVSKRPDEMKFLTFILGILNIHSLRHYNVARFGGRGVDTFEAERRWRYRWE